MSYYGQQQQQSGGFYGQSNDPYNTHSQYNYDTDGSNNDSYNWQTQQQQQQPRGDRHNAYGWQPHQPAAPLQQTSNLSTSTTPAFWNPATAATITAMASTFTGATNQQQMLDIAGIAGKSFLQSSTARMIPGLESTMLALRSYFAVDNSYVLLKMKRVLFPFLFKTWKRQEKERPPSQDGSIPPVSYMLPVHDECAPDLYLPIMSLITYVLLCALLYGTAGQFNPEVIPSVTSTCIICQSLEVAAIRLGFYLMQSPIAILDLFSYTGYKYLGLCINMMIGILIGHVGLGTRGYYVSFLWTASAAAYFMMKTMANNIPLRTAANGPKREVMVVAFAASQFATMWFVSQTKFL